MKKLMYCLSCGLMIMGGAFAFSGCSTGSDEVKSIKIKTLPNDVNYEVYQTLDLTGGKFTVEYQNGKTHDFDMSSIQLAFIDYDDGKTGNTFTCPSDNQSIVLRYGGKSTTFNVNVEKAKVNPIYQKNYSTIYNGERQPLSQITNTTLGLNNDVTLTSIEYKAQDSETYSTAFPVDAGTYQVRLNINGGANYENKVIDDITYTIEKSTLFNYIKSTQNNKTLSFLNKAIQYGQTFDPDVNWAINSTNTVTSLRDTVSESIANAGNIRYEYRLTENDPWQALTPSTILPVPSANSTKTSYDVRVLGSWASNFSDLNMVFTNAITVTQKTLVCGTDYHFVIKKDGVSQAYTAPLEGIFQQYTVGVDEEITVDVVFDNVDVNSVVKQTTKVITFRKTLSNATTTITNTVGSNPGKYVILLSVEFNNSNYKIDNNANLQGFIVVNE